MAAKYILAAVGLGFLLAGTARLVRDGGRRHPQSRAWLLVGVIFVVVSGWLFARG